MDTITSSEFRKRYGSLKVPTTVTVSGHPIGTWVPAPDPMTPERERAIREEWANLGKPKQTVEFRPAPKPGH